MTQFVQHKFDYIYTGGTEISSTGYKTVFFLEIKYNKNEVFLCFVNSFYSSRTF